MEHTEPTPTPEQLSTQERHRTTELEKEARIQLVLTWMDDGWKGKRLAQRITKEFGLSERQAYDYIRWAQELEESLVAMQIPDLQKFVKRNYLRLLRAKDKKVSLQATDRLAKHAKFFPPTETKVDMEAKVTDYDKLSREELEALAADEPTTETTHGTGNADAPVRPEPHPAEATGPHPGTDQETAPDAH